MKDCTKTGRANEQFEGELVATLDDMMQRTAIERAALGYTDPSYEKVQKMLWFEIDSHMRQAMDIQHPTLPTKGKPIKVIPTYR